MVLDWIFYSLDSLFLLVTHTRLFRITESFGSSSLKLRVYPSEVFLFALSYSPNPFISAFIIYITVNIPALIKLRGLFPGSKRPVMSVIFRSIQVLPYISLGFIYNYFYVPENTIYKLIFILTLGLITVFLNRLLTSILGQLHRYRKISLKNLATDLQPDERILSQWLASLLGWLITFSFFLKEKSLLNPNLDCSPPLFTLYLSLNILGFVPFISYKYFVNRYAQMNTVISTLATMLHYRDEDTYAHSLRVKHIAKMLAQKLNLSEVEIARIGRAALLHDIGKLEIPDSILLKTGKLTPHEYNIITFHPLIALKILREFQIDEYVDAESVLFHHEKYSGGGYPYNLKYDDIPLGARIISVADVFDALASPRPYKRSIPLNQVMDFIRAHSGIYFDPEVVEKLYELYTEGKLEGLYKSSS